MHINEIEAFAEFWSGAWEAVGRNLTGRAIDFTFEALKAYRLDEVKSAVALHMQGPKGRNPPTVADVVDIIQQHHGSISADEAWAAAALAADESQTVIWTQPMADAWGVALPIFQAGDEVGARMAFRAHYERSIAMCRAQGITPRYWVSQGTDPVLRDAVVQDGIKRGMLPPASRDVFALPAPTGGIAGLLEAAESLSEQEPDKAQAAIGAIKRLLTGPSDDERAAEKAAARDDFERRKKDQLRRLDEYRCRKEAA